MWSFHNSSSAAVAVARTRAAPPKKKITLKNSFDRRALIMLCGQDRLGNMDGPSEATISSYVLWREIVVNPPTLARKGHTCPKVCLALGISFSCQGVSCLPHFTSFLPSFNTWSESSQKKSTPIQVCRRMEKVRWASLWFGAIWVSLYWKPVLLWWWF